MGQKRAANEASNKSDAKEKPLRKPAAKKSKDGTKKEVAKKSKEGVKKEQPELPFKEKTWHLDKDRHVTLKKFHGQIIVDVREFYVDKLSREMTPGKKGISLTLEQFKKFKSLFSILDESFPTFSAEKDYFDPLA